MRKSSLPVTQRPVLYVLLEAWTTEGTVLRALCASLSLRATEDPEDKEYTLGNAGYLL